MSLRRTNRRLKRMWKWPVPTWSWPWRRSKATGEAEAEPPDTMADDWVDKSQNRRREHPMWLVMAWLVPVTAAIIAFASPFLGVQVHEYLLQTGHFFVREVVVDGNEHLSEEDLLDLAGIRAGTHVLAADLEDMAARIRSHSWVSFARVDRELPDRLLLTITEHHPVAFVALDELMIVNTLGEPFTLAGPDDQMDLPILSGLAPDAFDTNARAAVARADVRAAVNLTRLYEAMGFTNRWPIGEVRIEPGRRLTLVISETGTEAILGTGPYRQKLYRLEWVLEMLYQQGQVAQYVLLHGTGPSLDGRDDGRVIIRADLALSQGEAADEASRRASQATSLDAGRPIIELDPDPSWQEDGILSRPRAVTEGLLPTAPVGPRAGHGAGGDTP